ncbi:hypothetical protein F4810DRAFT_649354 [Camillea tinctor]|nr:hypothetical protein F4810DRAFT_649354 [Camillea tinctor]
MSVLCMCVLELLMTCTPNPWDGTALLHIDGQPPRIQMPIPTASHRNRIPFPNPPFQVAGSQKSIPIGKFLSRVFQPAIEDRPRFSAPPRSSPVSIQAKPT